LSDEQDPTGMIELASNSIAPFKHELLGRLGVELDERDALAVETGLLKAFLRGLAEGSAETTERVIDQSVPPSVSGSGLGLGLGRPMLSASELSPPVPDVDPWAERYGD
jgi:hypothetical protein